LIQCFSIPSAELEQAGLLTTSLERADELQSVINKHEASRTTENLICCDVALDSSDTNALVGKVAVDMHHPFFLIILWIMFRVCTWV